MRTIDADSLEDVVTRLNENGRGITRHDYKLIDSVIFEFPTIEPERPTGRWFNDISYSGWTCTNCHYHDGNKTDRYCPNCGAKMEKEN